MNKAELIAHLQSPKSGHKWYSLSSWVDMMRQSREELNREHVQAHEINVHHMMNANMTDPHAFLEHAAQCDNDPWNLAAECFADEASERHHGKSA